MRAIIALGLLWLAAVPAPRARAGGGSLEYPIKAAFLEKFGAFVTWPPAALDDSRSFTICVLGEDPFGTVVDRAVGGHSLDGRPMAVRRIATADESAGCQILYIGRTRGVDGVLAHIAGRPILTVTDNATWTGQPKGIIHFVIRDNRVRFVIDDAAAARDGLAISSKLLSIALGVNPRPRGTP